jgi:succinate dehydrogenase / fumarate reductase flavoprotein subunit/fumarate reductase flavoprotein subunit
VTGCDELEADILILGAGGAGLLAALHAHEKNRRLKIAIAVKGLLGQSGCTRMVQGGYNAVLHPADSLERHFEDTVKGGAFLNNQRLAWVLVEDAPKRIIELENKVGCLFDRNDDGTLHQKAFAGQSFDRTVHKGDLTGIEIMSNLRDYILEEEILVLEECRGLDLLTGGVGVCGALLLDNRRGRFIAARAKAILLCTGAGATMYRISSPSLEKAGDGMAMAYRAGAEFVDMEMMQFHPTGLLVGGSMATGGLLEEGLRGAGARLFNGLGERFMEKWEPVKLERATRDVISRYSYLEIMAGRGTQNGGVWLDATHLGEDFLMRNFPGMVERCGDYGFDLIRSRVEVSPSAHYHMGGVEIDLDGRSNLEGLFVAGEDAGGVHGANRLGGNGVADSIVFGARAGDAMAGRAASSGLGAVSPDQTRELCGYWAGFLDRHSGENPFELRRKLEDLMWEKVGLVRSGDDLKAAIATIGRLRECAEDTGSSGHAIYNAKWNEAINVINMTLVAEMIARSALMREESRGAHYRSDYPAPDPAWLRNIVIAPDQGQMRFSVRPVEFTHLEPQEIQQIPRGHKDTKKH